MQFAQSLIAVLPIWSSYFGPVFLLRATLNKSEEENLFKVVHKETSTFFENGVKWTQCVKSLLLPTLFKLVTSLFYWRSSICAHCLNFDTTNSQI